MVVPWARPMYSDKNKELQDLNMSLIVVSEYEDITFDAFGRGLMPTLV